MRFFNHVPHRALLVGALAVGLTVPALAHIERGEPMQSMRQSFFALVGMSFGPMGDMAKGDIPWDDAQFTALAEDLAGLSGYDVERAFTEDSKMGKTRARPEIWDNMDDFNDKLAAFRVEASKLYQVSKGSDQGAKKKQLGAVGNTCKNCHDDYKSKDYLY